MGYAGKRLKRVRSAMTGHIGDPFFAAAIRMRTPFWKKSVLEAGKVRMRLPSSLKLTEEWVSAKFGDVSSHSLFIKTLLYIFCTDYQFESSFPTTHSSSLTTIASSFNISIGMTKCHCHPCIGAIAMNDFICLLISQAEVTSSSF